MKTPGIMTLVTTMQLQLLKSAREDGLIPFPAGSAAAVRRALGELEILESQGCVEHAERNGLHAYWITEQGAIC